MGAANLKVLRMEDAPYPEECHPFDEALLVLEGEMQLIVADRPVPVRSGELYVVPTGVRHSVGPGSRGTLIIVDL